MPESRSRSRKRKAPATAAAGKGASSDVEKDTQSQSSVLSTGKEERYVPRFGPSSAGKRARTAGHGAVFSCSQPVAQPQPSSGTRVRRASGNATEEDIDNSIHTADGTAPDKVEETNTKYADGSVGEGNLTEGAVEDLDTQLQEVETQPVTESIPGFSLTQSLPPAPQYEQPLQPPPSPTPIQPSLSPNPKPPLSPTSVKPTAVGDDYCDEAVRQTSGEGMNLDLLDPLECNEEEEEEETGSDSVASTQMIDEGAKDTASCGDQITAPLADPPQDTLPLPSSPPHPTPHRTHSPLLHTPPLSPITTNLHQREPSVPEVRFSPCHSLYDDNRRDKADDGGSGKGVTCDDVRVEECGEMGGGVEDAVVVGGSSGDLRVSTGYQKATHEIEKGTSHHEREEEEEELLAVREMMDLTAHDLLETQLIDEATVPSLSPLTTHPPSTCRPEGAEERTSSAVVAEGSQILRGLIQELSSLNQYVLACKRELEAQRRRRAAWMRSQSAHRGR